MPSVKIKEQENFESALRRFKRKCEKENIMSEKRRREFYEKPTEVRTRKRAAARKRLLKRLAKQYVPPLRGRYRSK